MDSETPTPWYLEGCLHEEGPVVRIAVGESMVRIGRQPNLEVVLRDDSVSRLHAELVVREGRLWLKDCASRNGTFVNRQRIRGEVPLNVGDVVHFARCEFLVGCVETIVPLSSGIDTMVVSEVLPQTASMGATQLAELIRGEHVRCIYEPIVEAVTRQLWAYEVLGRGALEGFFESPLELFAIASPLGLQAELSRVFRRAGVKQAPVPLPSGGLFVNIHPTEMNDSELLVASFSALRREAPTLPLTLELPEALVTNEQVLHRVRNELRGLHVGLAYDDFGAGQARLVELARVPPDYLKFDKKLIGSLERDERVRDMVEVLVRYAHDAGVRCIAEGIESAPQADVATSVGFDLLQGYLFTPSESRGHPTPRRRHSHQSP